MPNVAKTRKAFARIVLSTIAVSTMVLTSFPAFAISRGAVNSLAACTPSIMVDGNNRTG